MGSKYFELQIGDDANVGWSWKHDFPPIYSLPFAQCIPLLIPSADDEDDGAQQYAFRQDASAALETLSQLGLSDAYFETTWASFRSFPRAMALAGMGGMEEGREYAMKHPLPNPGLPRASFPSLRPAIRRLEQCSAAGEITAAISLLRDHGWKDWNQSLLDGGRPLLPLAVGLSPGDWPLDFVAESVALGGFLHDAREAYSEIVALFEMYLLFKAAVPTAVAEFKFASEYVSSAEVAAEYLSSKLDAVADKVRLYNDTFVALTDGKGHLQQRLRRNTLETAWTGAKADGLQAYEKGSRLERFTDLLLAEVEGLVTIEKNLRTQTAELDIVLQNNVARPFWTNLGSPLLFVECKNWVDRVDVREARAIESKMRERGRITRLSFLFSMSGFTKAFADHVASLSRDDLLIVAIQGTDIDKLFSSPRLDVTRWLELLIATQASGASITAQKPPPSKSRKAKRLP